MPPGLLQVSAQVSAPACKLYAVALHSRLVGTCACSAASKYSFLLRVGEAP